MQRRKRVWARNQAVLTDVGTAGTADDMAAGFIADMGTAHLPVGITIGGILLDITASRVVAGTDVTTSQLQVGVIVAVAVGGRGGYNARCLTATSCQRARQRIQKF